MKKTYEKPVLTTEQFDVESVITASAAKLNPPTYEGFEVPVGGGSGIFH